MVLKSYKEALKKWGLHNNPFEPTPPDDFEKLALGFTQPAFCSIPNLSILNVSPLLILNELPSIEILSTNFPILGL